MKNRVFPEEIILYLTKECPYRCHHCFFRSFESERESRETFTLFEIENVSKSIGNFCFLTLGGGEPFLREDISEIAYIFFRNNKVRRISIPTSGWDKEVIFKKVEAILKKVSAKVIVKISIEGDKEINDRIRGKGSFLRAKETFFALKELKKYKNFSLGILSTYSKVNEDFLFDFLKKVQREWQPDRIGVNFLRGKVEMGEGDIKKFVEGYKEILKRIRSPFYRIYKNVLIEEIEKIKRGEDFYKGKCPAGVLHAIISYDLEVFPCEVLYYSFGNLRDSGYNFRRVWNSERANMFRDRIRKKCNCTYECTLQLSNFFSPTIFLDLLKRTLCELL